MMKQIKSCMSMSPFSIIAILLVGLSGCGSMEPLPSDTFYRIKIATPAVSGSNSAQWTEKMVRVAKFRGTGVHRERAIAYSGDDQLVVKQHRYHLWVDSPEHILQNELVSYLRAAGVSPAVSTSALSNEGLEIRVQIHQMDHVVVTNGASAVIALAFEVVRKNSGEPLVLGKDYRESRSLSSSDMGAVAVAMSDAVGTIFERFVADATTALLH